MSLNQSLLETKLRELIDPDYGGFLGFPPDVDAAGNAWADAYDTYAAGAIDVSGDPVVTVNKASFASIFKAGFSSPSGSASGAAQTFEDAFVGFWTGGVFAVGVPPPGVAPCPNSPPTPMVTEASSVVSMITTGVLKGLLETEFASLGDNGAAKAAALANWFHAATTSAVLVLISGVDAIGNPVTNLCPIS